MDLPTSPTTPLGPMTRARAKAIEDMVNSLLSELPIPTYETWLLPHAETLCVIRCLEESLGSATPFGQDGGGTKFNAQEEGLLETPRLRTTDNDWTSDAHRTTDAWKLQTTSQVPAFARYSGRTTDADRTSDITCPEKNQRTPDARRTSGPS